MSKQNFQEIIFFKVSSLKPLKKSHELKQTLKLWRDRLIESVPFLIACAVFLSVISLKSPILLFCLLIGSLITIIIQQIGQQVHLPRRSLIILQILASIIILSLFWLDYFAAPAQAQFFRRAENFFTNNLTQGSSNNNSTQAAISLVFNVLRALYLLYIAVALISVINAVRKDEDWQNVVRTPILVVVAVTIADVLTGFVIGDNSK